MTKKYGILGFPAKHSLSPLVQNVAFKAADIDAEYRVYEILPEKLSEFMENVRHEPISGLSVTAPHKVRVTDFLDNIDEDAHKIGAVNTVVNKGGFLHGYNVDFIGTNKALMEKVGSLKGKKVAVLGAGGAARSTVYGFLKEGAGVGIYNRTAKNANEIAKYFSDIFGVEVVSGGLEEIEGGDILVQATSIWITEPDAKCEDLISKEQVDSFDVVMDIIYKPLITPLLEVARDMGKIIISGDKMFIYQAFEQFKLWTGKEAPKEEMNDALKRGLV